MISKIFKLIYLTIINLLLFLIYIYQQSGLLTPYIKGTLINNQINININYKELDSIKIEEEINKFRIENELNTLVRYPKLCTLAIERVIEIQDEWSHDGFEDREDLIYTKYCNDNNIICTSAGENLAKGQFYTEQKLVQEWINSPDHKENMLKDYNVQCVALQNNHYVSLFAKTQDLQELEQLKNDILNKNIDYDYEKVMYWENQIIINEKYIKNWNSSNDNSHYNQDDVNKLLDILNNKNDIAKLLWDGITNQKITLRKEQKLQEDYINESSKSFELSIKLNNDAFDNCIKNGIESDICEVYIK